MVQIPIVQLLPKIYWGLLPEFFQQCVPKEEHVTCAECAMCPPAEHPRSYVATYFSAASKCCTYHPDLPNFLVGGILASKNSALDEGKRRIGFKIRGQLGVVPHGILAPRKYRFLFRKSGSAFGRALSMVCPYFNPQGGMCTIWSFREAVASIYHCKHNFGEDGRRFWAAVGEYLEYAERVLANYALRALNWPSEEILLERGPEGDLLANELDERAPDIQIYKTLWRNWIGREEDFFQRSYHAVLELDRGAFQELGGIYQKLLLDRIEARYDYMLSPDLPDPLVRNPTMVEEKMDPGYLLASYSQSDPVYLREEIFNLLYFFDGRTSTSRVLQLIRDEKQCRISQGLLTRLYQHRVLIAGEPHPELGTCSE